MEGPNQKQILREEYELLSANIKSILQKRRQKTSPYERQFLLNAIKKVKFIKQSFDTNSSKFGHILKGVGLEMHQKNSILFEKGDPGYHFYIVLEGVYCVEIDNVKEGKKEKQIYYYPGDSFGEVSLIYDVPRGTRIISDQKSSVLTITKQAFNDCGDLKKNILTLNNYFSNHPYFQNEEKFMIRVVSSISKLVKFEKNEILVDEGSFFGEILFFVKGEARVYQTLELQNQKGRFTETIQIDTLMDGDVFGEYFYTNKLPSTVRIVSTSKGEMIKINFKDDIHSVENALYKRIRQNAQKYPNNEQLLSQYKIYLEQKYKQIDYLSKLYKNDKDKKLEAVEAKKRLNRVANSWNYE